MLTHSRITGLVLGVFLAGGCGDNIRPDLDSDARVAIDARVNTDAKVDTDAQVDIDAGVDAAVDASADAAVDASVDAAVDASVDAAVDAGVDAQPANTAPVISAVGDQTTSEDTALVDIAFTVGDAETVASALVVTAVSSNPAVIAQAGVLLGGAGADRTITLQPVANAFGTSTITITVDDGEATTQISFVVTVTPVNDPPIAIPDSFLGDAGTNGNMELVVTGSVLGNDSDIDGPNLTVTAFSGAQNSAQNGDVTMNADGTFRYTPATGFLGIDSFSYEVSDNDPTNPRTAMATVTIEVSAPMIWFVDNTAPTAGDGRSVSPFARLKSVETAPVTGSGDVIVVAYGDGTSTNQDEGIVLRDNQLLLGGAILPVAPVITNTGGNAITLASGNTVATLVIQAPSGAGIFASGVDGTTTIAGVTINDASGGGVSLQNSAGAVFDLDGVAITTTGGAGFLASNAGQVSVANTTVQSTNGPAVQISDTSLASVTFTSVQATNPSGNGVRLINNTGALTFESLNVSNSEASGLLVDNSGTLTISGNGNTISTSTAAAVSIANTTLAVTLQRVSATSATSGMVLNNTGGSFAVTGDGTGAQNGSGGVIGNMSGPGVSLDAVSNISLGSMTIQNTGDDGIFGRSVNGLALRGVLVSATGDAAGDHGVELNDLFGSNVIDGTRITGSAVDGLRIFNSTGTLTSLAITGSRFEQNSATLGNVGINLESRGSARMESVSIANSTFSALQTTGVLANAVDTSFLQVSATGSTFNGNNIAWDMHTAGQGSLVFDFSGNPVVTGHESHAINVFTAGTSTGGSVRGTIAGNTIGTAGAGGSGSASGYGIRVNINGQAHGVIGITGNTIQEVEFGRGIEARARLGTGTLDLTLANNNVTTHPVNGLAAVFVGSTDSNRICANIRGNTAAGGPYFPGPFGGAYIVGEGDTTQGSLQLEGFVTDVPATLAANGNAGTPVSQLGTNITAPAVPCEIP